MLRPYVIVRQKLTKQDRLSSTDEIRAIRLKGKRHYVDPIVVFRYPNELKTPRIAVTITRKAGKSVVRNQAKRKIRELFRRNKDIMGSYDYVFFASKGLAPLSADDWKRIAESIISWCKGENPKSQYPISNRKA